MRLESVWTSLVYVFNVLTFSVPDGREASQAPLSKPDFDVVYGDNLFDSTPHPIDKVGADGFNEDDDDDEHDAIRSYVMSDGTPVVGTPKNGQEGGSGLECKYPNMTEWESCYGPKSRDCWLRKKDGSKVINITTDYENPEEVPVGITRKVRGADHIPSVAFADVDGCQYYLDISEMPISPDGTTMEHGKVFNRSYPGPWIGE